jgi:hypothetical protein
MAGSKVTGEDYSVIRFSFLAVACLVPSMLVAQRTAYLGVSGGIATLSGDGSAAITSSSAATSLFDPRNGIAANVFFGMHVWNYVSLQANYSWNRNDVVLVSTAGTLNELGYYRQPESVTQNAFLGDVLVYFRKRTSRIRPYLSEGVGFVQIGSRFENGGIARGVLAVPPSSSSHISPALRTAVGLDVRLRRGWYFRYSFGETLSRNTFGNQLSPPEKRIPKNFQNLFGFFRVF